MNFNTIFLIHTDELDLMLINTPSDGGSVLTFELCLKSNYIIYLYIPESC